MHHSRDFCLSDAIEMVNWAKLGALLFLPFEIVSVINSGNQSRNTSGFYKVFICVSSELYVLVFKHPSHVENLFVKVNLSMMRDRSKS